MIILPKVVIVGRMNVGKSTVFNRLSTDVKSLTLDYEGVTRDFLTDVVNWGGRSFEIVDTGGISLRKTQDIILEAVRQKALDLLQEADVVMFVCDAKVGIVPEDREISKVLHKTGKPVILVANKADSKMSEEHQFEFERLGHQPVLFISAQHGTGIGELLEEVVNALPKTVKEVEDQKPTCKVVFLGKPNVGKSSLMNLLLKQERSIVTDQPGTTREAISESITFYSEDIQVTDTPGVRRKRSIDEPLESMMVKSSLRAVKDADIILLLVDATEGQLSDQELKLAFYAFNDQYKSLIILYNKQDIVEGRDRELMEFNTEPYDYFLKKLVKLDISCKTGRNIGKILPLIQEVWQRQNQKFSKNELSGLFKEAMERTPLYHKTKALQIHWARQLYASPITILMVVNETAWFGDSQLSFFENIMRKQYDLRGVPIRFVTRKVSST